MMHQHTLLFVQIIVSQIVKTRNIFQKRKKKKPSIRNTFSNSTFLPSPSFPPHKTLPRISFHPNSSSPQTLLTFEKKKRLEGSEFKRVKRRWDGRNPKTWCVSLIGFPASDFRISRGWISNEFIHGGGVRSKEA